MDAALYDLAVIGSGPAGQKGAIAAAKLGKRVVVVDRREMLGGGSVHTGTIPSKTLREAILYVSGLQQRSFYGRDYRLKEAISTSDLASRIETVTAREVEVVNAQLRRNGVERLDGLARFADPHTLEVVTSAGPGVVRADHILIASGARPAHNPLVPMDGRRIVDSDHLHGFAGLPREMIVVGAGIIGLEYASMMTALDTRVTIIEQRPAILDFVDHEITEALVYLMRQRGAIFRLGEKVVSVGLEDGERIVAHLESGKRVGGDGLLYTVGREANTDDLNLAAVGIGTGARGKVQVNEHFQTDVPHIYAAGDVIGFPALAATSAEQGRLASCHMFGVPARQISELLPYGIYTIPEISMVGRTEKDLTDAKVPYEIGVARFDELARGQILGVGEGGLLKILFDPESLRLLGVHVIGDSATELVHIGQAILSLGATIEYFRDTVFNYPTLAEAYKVAALNGFNRIRGVGPLAARTVSR